jgi:serine/threonine protein kinase
MLGPSIAFYGCLWTGEKIHLEPLTPGYDLRIHWTDEISRNAIASSLDALKKIISRLERYSQDLATLATLVTTSSKMRMFPYPTSYEDETKVEIRFTYRSRIDDKLIFRAAVNGSDEDTLCIKFTRRYSEKAHRLLAELGHAPRLRAVSSLPGGWIMIVMDLSRYDPLYLLPFPPRSASESKHVVRSKIRDIVQKLHDNNLVHGDIRDINILVDRKTIISKDSCAIHLLDFDWAGTEGEVRYPERVNTKSVRRPDGVSDRELITKGHDMAMVDFLWAPPIGGMFSNSS